MTRGSVRRLGAAGLVLGCLVVLPGQAAADDPAFSVAPGSVTEGAAGNEITFDVTFTDPAPEGGYTLSYSVTHGTTTNADFDGAMTGNVGVAAGGTTATIKLKVVNDALDEAPETFTLNVSKETGASDTATGTINDNDAAPVATINSAADVPEGNTGATNKATFTVTLSAVSGRDARVNYATVDNSARVADQDYVPASSFVTIPAGQRSKTFDITVTGDVKPESDETFFVILTQLDETATVGEPHQGAANIKDDDDKPTITIADAQMLENGPPVPPNVAFTVKLSKATTQPVTMLASTSDGTAIGGTDYDVKSGATITFAPGDPLTKTFSVPIKSDTLDEPNETFNVTLSAPAGATIADGAAVGTILDDDNVSAFSITDASADEPSSGTATMTFTVTLAPASKRTVRVAYDTADGTASALSDYTASSGTLEFEPDQTTKTITVPIQGDTINEENETLAVNLTSPAGAKIGDGQGQGTIIDKNAPPSLSISDAITREGQGATFTVTLAGTTLRTVTVSFNTIEATAKAGSDFAARSGTLTFAAGEKAKTITVTVLDDTAPEPTEDFFVGIGDAVNATITKNRGLGAIEGSDQVAQPPTTDPKKPVAKPASVLVPRMILGPRTVSIGVNGIARMLVTCQKLSPIRCAGTVELERAARPLLKLGKKTFTVTKGAKGYASIKLSAKTLKLLRKNGTMRAKVIVLVKTSTKTMKVSPGIITLKPTKAFLNAKPKPAAPPTKVVVDP
jgi:hypothetical protein